MRPKKLLSNVNANIISPAELNAATISNSPVWVHIDWDVLEPGFLPADYEIANGLTPSQIQDVLESIPIGNIKGIELAEFNAHANKEENDDCLEKIINIFESALNSYV